MDWNIKIKKRKNKHSKLYYWFANKKIGDCEFCHKNLYKNAFCNFRKVAYFQKDLIICKKCINKTP